MIPQENVTVFFANVIPLSASVFLFQPSFASLRRSRLTLTAHYPKRESVDARCAARQP